MRSLQVLVATDAVGMGLNLNIRRMIFYSLTKLQLLESGEKEMDLISVSQALQIAGRAGRFGTQWETGYVTCFHQEEIPVWGKCTSLVDTFWHCKQALDIAVGTLALL